jgi:hypothetical protein
MPPLALIGGVAGPDEQPAASANTDHTHTSCARIIDCSCLLVTCASVQRICSVPPPSFNKDEEIASLKTTKLGHGAGSKLQQYAH